jgi:mycothiol system anti-sigma-R factor
MSESNCKDALHQLYEFLDGELTEDKRAAIKHHLDGCQPCAQPYDFEAELRLIIRKKCAETVPDSLMIKIREALAAEAKTRS